MNNTAVSTRFSYDDTAERDIVAIYKRLSDEDRDKRNKEDESASLQNQESMLRAYAEERSWEVYDIYCDEDRSGADRNRPDWNRLIADAESRKFNIVLCKHQSRFCREMEMVEKYIHDKFLEWNIRFVSIVDHADTEVKGNKKARQINGLINEWYLEDLSDNIRRTLNHKKQSGEWTGSFAPYGYMRDPNEPNHLVVDPIAAEVVKEVFDMFLSGMGYVTISKTLNTAGVPNPSTYKANNGSKFKTKNTKVTSSVWTNSTIYQMLRREVYTGTLIQGISENISYKNKKRRRNPPAKWFITQNAHEAIISMETWEAVREKLKTKKRVQRTGTIHIFAGKVFCKECGNILLKSTAKGRSERYHYLKCKTPYSSNELCPFRGSIRFDAVENVVKDRINKILDEFYCPELIQLPNVPNNDSKANALIAERQDIIKLIEKKEQHLSRMYKDRLEEIITEKMFSNFSSSCNKEIDEYNNRLSIIENAIANIKNEKVQSESKEALLKKYRHIDELDSRVVSEFIKAIYIGKLEDEQREIIIEWNF